MKKGDASFSRDGVVILIAVHLIGFIGLHASSFLFHQGVTHHHLVMFFSMIEFPGYMVLDFLSKGWILAWRESHLGYPAIFVMNTLLYGGAGFLLGMMVDGIREFEWRDRFERLSGIPKPSFTE
jgi:hypothetical protein